MSFCFLYNPSTNRQRSHKKFIKLKKLTKDWPQTEYLTTDSRNNLQSLAKKKALQYETVVACGGDGTVRDVAVALMDTEAKLGIIPLGSGNDFSKSIGLSTDLQNSVNKLQTGDSKFVSIGKCNDFYFTNTLGFGFDGQTNLYATESKVRIGSVRYALAALKANLFRKPFSVKICLDGNEFDEKDWMMVTAANGRVEGGNFIIAPDATPFDSTLRVVMIKPVPKWLLPFLLPFFVLGGHQWIPYFNCVEAEKLNLSFDRPVFIHTDGEQINSNETEFEINLIHEAIEVIC
ncbi:MAG: diacylglycerol/lipid kinase family protein [Candidatus Halalkalibacterium sp. M3_1C_030]